MQWRYPRFRLWQFASSGAVTLSGMAIEYFRDGFPDSGWDGGILYDGQIRDALVADTRDERERAARISDILWPSVQYFPVIDGIVTPLVSDKLNFDVATQLTLINWQAIGISFLILRTSHVTVGRARPSIQECDTDPDYDGACYPTAPGRTASFYSGHTNMAFTSAALTCMHHMQLELYGHPVADGGICALGMGASVATGVLRIRADKHWASDVWIGALQGTVTGLAVPWLLHYRYGPDGRERKGGLPEGTAVGPMVAGDRVGLQWFGVF